MRTSPRRWEGIPFLALWLFASAVDATAAPSARPQTIPAEKVTVALTNNKRQPVSGALIEFILNSAVTSSPVVAAAVGEGRYEALLPPVLTGSYVISVKAPDHEDLQSSNNVGTRRELRLELFHNNYYEEYQVDFRPLVEAFGTVTLRLDDEKGGQVGSPKDIPLPFPRKLLTEDRRYPGWHPLSNYAYRTNCYHEVMKEIILQTSAGQSRFAAAGVDEWIEQSFRELGGLRLDNLARITQRVASRFGPLTAERYRSLSQAIEGLNFSLELLDADARGLLRGLLLVSAYSAFQQNSFALLSEMAKKSPLAVDPAFTASLERLEQTLYDEQKKTVEELTARARNVSVAQTLATVVGKKLTETFLMALSEHLTKVLQVNLGLSTFGASLIVEWVFDAAQGLAKSQDLESRLIVLAMIDRMALDGYAEVYSDDLGAAVNKRALPYYGAMMRMHGGFLFHMLRKQFISGKGQGGTVEFLRSISSNAYHRKMVEISNQKMTEAEISYARISAAGPFRSRAVSFLPPHEASGEVVMVIDSSGSMSQNDPERLRHQAAKMLAGRLVAEHDLAVVDFDSKATILNRHTRNLEAVLQDIDSIDSSGNTCIAAGLGAASAILKDTEGGGLVILFTDGISGCPDDHDPWFTRNNVPIYVIGLSGAVNERSLQQLALSTGGEYMKARTAVDLPGIFDWMGTMAGREDLVDVWAGKIKQGESRDFMFPVDGLAEKLSIRMWYPGSRLTLDVFGPNDTPVATGSSGVRRYEGRTYSIVEVDNPQTGTWMARIKGIETEPDGEPFKVRVGAKSSSRVSVEADIPRQEQGNLGFGLAFDQTAIKAKKFQAKVIFPNGQEAALDSVTPGRWVVSRPAYGGTHQFLFFLEGTDRAGRPLRRIAQKSLYFEGPAMPAYPVLTRVVGAVGWISMGRNIGLRPGMRLEIRSKGKVIGYGNIVSVYYDFAQVELSEHRGRMWVAGDEAVPLWPPEILY